MSTPLERALDPTTSADELHQLANGEEEGVKEAVAGNPNAAAATLGALAEVQGSRRAAILQAIEANPALMMMELVADTSEPAPTALQRVQRALASTTADPERRARAAQDAYVREWLHANPYLSDKEIRQFYDEIRNKGYFSSTLYVGLLQNPNLPHDIANAIAKRMEDANVYVGKDPHSRKLHALIASQAHLTPDKQRPFADAATMTIEGRQGLASNRRLAWDLAEVLANDKHIDVRAILAKNPAVQEKLLQKLAADPVRRVRESAQAALDRIAAARAEKQLARAQRGGALPSDVKG